MTATETFLRHAYAAGILLLMAACAEEPPPVSVYEFMENPRLLEATMVRCGQNRAEMKYEVDCINARDAANRIASAEEQARRAELERQSERKRQALRRTQQAAAEARRRALEEQRLREEEQYLGIITDEVGPAVETIAPQPENAPLEDNAAVTETIPPAETTPPADAGQVQPTDGNLDAIREELRRRQESPQP